MTGLLERLAAGQVLVADGAMGTMLYSAGLEVGACPESLCLTRAELLGEIATSYLEAGADLIGTNTFGASPLNLEQYQLAAQTEEINLAAVRAVREAVGQRALVVASMGPSGKLLLPHGDTAPEVLADSFTRQARVLVEAGVDAVVVETMTDLTEATLAVQALKAAASELPVLATMTFDPTPRGFFTIMGTDVAAAVAGLTEAGADVVGANCGHGIETMTELAKAVTAASELPVLIQSNAGLPEMEGDQVRYREAPAFWAERAGRLLDLGVAVVGGCCGTTPEHIAALRAEVDRRQS